MPITKIDWGNVSDKDVFLYTIENRHGLQLSVTNYGAAVARLLVPDRNGVLDDVVLGYSDLSGYINGNSFHGATAGRFANRISGGQFVLDGDVYYLPRDAAGNCLHAGPDGFHRQVFTEKSVGENALTLEYVSPDGECGFPGELTSDITFALDDNNAVIITYDLHAEKHVTIANLTNHSYFNLGGRHAKPESVLATELCIKAGHYTPVDDSQIPTGEKRSVRGTAFDFTASKPIGAAGQGYDHNFLPDGYGDGLRKIAWAFEKDTGRFMTVYTDLPGVQLYTGDGLNEKGKAQYTKHSGFCLETQFSPDTPNLPREDFPRCDIPAGQRRRYETRYVFSVK